MATLVLGGVGAALGSVIPGLGTMAGFQIGAAIGSFIDASRANTGSPLSDLRYSGSQYGTAIHRVWGDDQVPGIIIWVATDSNGNHLVKHSGGGGGSGGGQSQDWYSASLAVYFGAATITMPDGSQVCRNWTIRRIWADDEVIYDSANPNSVLKVGTNLAIYPGSESQGQDPTMYAALGSKCPAHRGTCYAVIQNLNLSDFGQRIPSFRAEIVTDSVTVGTVFSDVARMCGLLVTDLDVTQATVAVTGMAITDRAAGDSSVSGLLQAYSFDAAEVDGVIRLVPRGANSVCTISSADLGARKGNGHSDNQGYHIIRKHITEVPVCYEVTFFDVANGFTQGVQRDVRRSKLGLVANQVATSLPLALTNDQGRLIASRSLDELWAEIESYEFALPYRYLWIAPGDPVTLPTANGNVRLRVTQIQYEGASEMRFRAVPDLQWLYTGQTVASVGGTAPTVIVSPTSMAVPTNFIAWSGTEIQDADTSAPGFYVAANGGTGWSGATVYYSSDGGTSWVSCGKTTSASTFGTTTSALASSGAVAGQFDTTNSVGVNVGFGTLATVSDSQIAGGLNMAYCGSEILSFGNASLGASTGLYSLTHIMRGERSTSMSGHVSGEMFVLLDASVLRIAVPSGLAGKTLQVKCVSNYQTLSDVTAQAVTISAPTPSATSVRLGQMVAPGWLATPVVFSKAATTLVCDGSWHTLTTTGVPAGASMLIIDGYAQNSGSPDNADQEVNFRPSSSWTSFLRGAKTRGVSGSYTGEQAFQLLVPCTGSQTFDYQITANLAVAEIRVVGYWA